MKLRDKKSVFASNRKGTFVETETASRQIHRERTERRTKRQLRQRKKMLLLTKRRGIRLESQKAIVTISLFKRMKWWLIKLWRKLFVIG